jgi:hypothetical protein
MRVTPPVTPRGRRGAASAAMWRRQPHHLPVGLQQGTCSFKRDFNTLLKFKRAFRVPRTQKGFSEGSLELNRGFRRILGTQQGFQKGSWNSTGVSEGSLELNRGFRRVVGTQQGFQKGPWNSTGVSEGWLELNRGFRRVLGTQQGFQKGPWNSTGVSEGFLELNRGFRWVLGTQQGFQKGGWNSTGVSEGSLELNRGFRRVVGTHRRGRTAQCGRGVVVVAARPRLADAPVALRRARLVHVRFCRHRFPATGLNSKATWFGS